jgi:eukaryotic-like serine/threonine-protein kinase
VALKSGTRIGPYEISAQIGVGGMGEVYHATDTNLKRAVAIKVLPDLVAGDIDRLARFQREAEVLASLNHPHIAGIYGLERSQIATALVMELVEGPTLADRIQEGALAIDDALGLAKQIADALEAAHDRGIVHRDLKPANVKVRSDGAVKVLDFGLAKALEPTGVTAASGISSPTITSPALMTRDGVLLGTAAYMSPEQARGQPVDKGADIWAFGVVLFEMLTGRRAFPGEQIADVLAAVLTRDPDWTQLPISLSPGVTALLKRCLEKNRKQRIRDIGDARLALDGAFDSGPVHVPLPAAARSPLWKRALPLLATAAVVVLLSMLTAWSRWPVTQPRKVTRFELMLPQGQQFRNRQRPIIAAAADGKSFVYETGAGLVRRLIGELDVRPVPVNESAWFSPILSPDGEWVAYFTVAGHIKKMPVTGGPAVTLCAVTDNLPLGATWTRDNTILFAQAAGIMQVSADGGTPELLVRAADGEQFYGPQLLPGGRAVLFSVTRSHAPNRWDESQVAVQELSSQRRTVIVQQGNDARYLRTGYVVYALRDGLFGVRFDASRMTVTSGPVPLVQGVLLPIGVFAAASNYSVSDDGTLVYVARGAPSLRSLVWINRDGSPGEAVSSIPADAYDDPRLSPDGKRVLVTRSGDIWVYELASGRSTRLTTDGSSLMGVWHPSGSQIAYSNARGGNLEAWVQPVDATANARQLTRLGGSVHVDSWSPDGNTLMVHRHPATASADMYAVRTDQSNAAPEILSPTAASEESAHLSRDGRYMAYISNETGQREIYIGPYKQSGERVSVSIGGGREPLWARNGDLFYRNDQSMFAVSVQTAPALKVGTPVRLFDGPYYISPTNSPRAQYDVTPDGKRFLMLLPARTGSSASDQARVIVIENWFDEIAARIPGR